MKVKEIIEMFQEMKPDDEVWITYLTTDDVWNNFADQEYSDKEGNPIDTEQYVTNESLKVIGQQLDTDEHLWQVFNESFSQLCEEKLKNLIEEAEEDKELWDKE